MPRRIASVMTDPATYRLTVTWSNKARTMHDMRALIRRRAVFKPLADRKLFASARVVDRGRALAWNDEIDYAADALWFEAHPGDNPFPDAIMTAEDFRKWMAENGLSLSTAAAALGLSRRQIAYYANGERPVPKLVFLACMSVSAARHRGARKTGTRTVTARLEAGKA